MSDATLNQEEIDMLLRDADDIGGQSPSSSGAEDTISFGKPTISQQDKDIFKHFLNEVDARSSNALSAILAGRGIKLKIEEIEVYTKDEIVALLNGSYAVFKSDVTGDFIGSLFILLEKAGAISIAGLATGYTQSEEEPLNEMTLSVIQEFLSIFTNSFTNTLKAKTKKNIAFPGIEVKEYTPSQIPFQDTDTFVKVLYLLTIDETISTNMHLIMNYDAVQSIMEFLRTETTMEAGASARPQQAPTQPPPQYQQQPYSQQAFSGGMGGGVGVGYEAGAQPPPTMQADIKKAEFAPFPEAEAIVPEGAENIELLLDVPLTLSVELGRTQMLMKDILALGEGSIIELDKLAGEPVDVLVNGRLIAKGEVVVIDENFGVRITDIVAPPDRIAALKSGG